MSLVQCPPWGVDDPPLGLAQLAGCAAHCGHEARVFDVNVRCWAQSSARSKELWRWDALPRWADADWCRGWAESESARLDAAAEDILREDPVLVAFSVAAGSQWTSLDLAARVKRRSPGVTVAMGGPFFHDARRAEEFVLRPQVDLVVSGAGEDVFPKLLGLFHASRRWVALPGVLVKSDGALARGGRPVSFTFDLDIAPPCDFSGFGWELYAKPGQVPASASRGCAASCCFCASREYWSKFSFKSGDMIFGDVSRALRQNPAGRHVEFYDINANGNPDSLSRFGEMALEHGMAGRGITWKISASISAETTPEALALWRRAGCREIVYGVESGSEGVLRRMNKRHSPELAEKVLRATREAGIRCGASFIAGFPGETEEDFRGTLEFVSRARDCIDSVFIQPASFEEPSLLFRRPELFGQPAEAEARAGRLDEWAASLGIEVDASRFSIGGVREPAPLVQ